MAAIDRAISEEVWQQHKDIILRLVRDNTKAHVIESLRTDHGFNITISQLEAQLKSWNHRKNLNHAEWQVVLDELDKLSNLHRSGRVSISGRPVSDGRIKRARRHCESRKGQLSRGPSRVRKQVDLSQVRIDVLQDDGLWHLHTDFRFRNNNLSERDTLLPSSFQQWTSASSLDETPVAPIHSLSPTSAGNDEEGCTEKSQAIGSFDCLQVSTELDHFPGSAADQMHELDSFEGVRQGLTQGFQTSECPWEPPSDLEAPLTIHAASAITMPESLQIDEDSVVPLAFYSRSSWNTMAWTLEEPDVTDVYEVQSRCRWASSWLRDLPFEKFERELRAKGLQLNSPWLVTSHSSHMQNSTHNPPLTFMRNLQKPSTTNFCSLIQNRERRSEHILSSLKHLENMLPVSMNQDDTHCHRGLISEDTAPSAYLNRMLVWSLVNGYAGLQDISIDYVLGYLTHYRHTSSLLLHFLGENQSYVAKALAENLLWAAIEARNETALKAVLKVPSIDVNKMSHIIQERQFTPIGRAAYLGSLELVRALRKYGANMAASLPDARTPFADLLDGLSDFSGRDDISLTEAPPEIVGIARELLAAGYIPGIDALERLLSIFKWRRGAKLFWQHEGDTLWMLRHESTHLIASEVIQHAHSDCVRRDHLSAIAEILEDSQAAAVINKVLEICQQHDESRCFTQAADRLDWALVVAARLGKVEVVRLLLPFSKHLYRALSAAIRSDNAQVIDDVLAYGPDMVAPAHNIDEDEFGERHNREAFELIRRGSYVTSYSEAVTAGNDKLIHTIEEQGYFDLLEDGRRFEPAIRAAAKTNDVLLLQNLLAHSHHPRSSDLSSALYYSLKFENEEASVLLLESGAMFQEFDTENILLGNLLRRKEHLIPGVLAAQESRCPTMYSAEDIDEDEYAYTHSIFREAVKLGDVGILTDLLATFPQVSLYRDELVTALQRNDLTIFNLLVKSKRIYPEAMTSCLLYAMTVGNHSMIRDLVDIGADPTDDEVLRVAADEYPHMLQTILKEVPRARRVPGPDAGKAALESVILRGTDGLVLVESLITSGVVNPFNVATPNYRLTNYDNVDPQYSPLGWAIKESFRFPEAIVDVVSCFLDTGCDPNGIARTNGVKAFSYSPIRKLVNETVLLVAIETRNLELVQFLIQRGADLHRSASLSVIRTPLQKACEVGSLDIVKLFLEKGADPNAEPARCHGATALQLAAIAGNCNIAAELLDHGADLNQAPVIADGRWPLEGAAEHGRLEMIEFLWRVCMAVNGRGFDVIISKYAMKYAEEKGYLVCRDLIKDLMENGFQGSNNLSTDSLSYQLWD